jgi:hypothetical protein
MTMASIAVGADDVGAPLKHQLTTHFQQLGYTVTDFGDGDGSDYPDVAVAVSVADGRHDRALLVCGTGLGMAIAANKVPGVRAVTAHDPYSAERAQIQQRSGADHGSQGHRSGDGQAGVGALAQLRIRGRPLNVKGRKDHCDR